MCHPPPIATPSGRARNPFMRLRKLLSALPALLVAMLLGAPLLTGQAVAQPVQSGHIEVEMVSQEAGAAPGGTFYVALRQKIIPS